MSLGGLAVAFSSASHNVDNQIEKLGLRAFFVEDGLLSTLPQHQTYIDHIIICKHSTLPAFSSSYEEVRQRERDPQDSCFEPTLTTPVLIPDGQANGNHLIEEVAAAACEELDIQVGSHD